MIPPKSSLLKYDNPLHVSANSNGKIAQELPASLCEKYRIPNKELQQTDDILNSILPPREWTEGSELWVQKVSSRPSTRLDVTYLQEELDIRLLQRVARETGICSIRRELYSQCFDELIRQVTIICAERGLLVLRIRDEIQMTIASYQTLYESSIAYGMRKALKDEKSKRDRVIEVDELNQQKSELENHVSILKAKCAQLEKNAVEQQKAKQIKHDDEIQFLKKTKQQLKAQLEGILIPKK